MHDLWFTGEMTLESWRWNWHPVLKLLQNLIPTCSIPVKVLASLTSPCFHGLRTLIHFKEDYFMFSSWHVGVWFPVCPLPQTCCTYACAVRAQPLARSLCTLTLTLTAWGLCSTSASKHAGHGFLCLRKGFAFGLTPLVHFRKSKLKQPLKDVCTEHRILSCSSALNMTFLFPFFWFCLTVRDASFLAWQLCRKIIIPHFVLRTNCAQRFYRVLEVEREGGCGGSTIKTGSTEYR